MLGSLFTIYTLKSIEKLKILKLGGLVNSGVGKLANLINFSSKGLNLLKRAHIIIL